MELRWNRARVLGSSWGCFFFCTGLDGNRCTVWTVHDGWMWVPNHAEMTARFEGWQLRLFGFYFEVTKKANIQGQAGDAIYQLNTSETDTSEVNNELIEIMVSFLKEEGEKIIADLDWNVNLLCSYQLCDDTVKRVNIAVQEVTVTMQATMMQKPGKILQRRKHLCKHRLQVLNFKPLARTLESPSGKLRMTTTLSWYNRPQYTEHYKSTSQTHYSLAY